MEYFETRTCSHMYISAPDGADVVRGFAPVDGGVDVGPVVVGRERGEDQGTVVPRVSQSGKVVHRLAVLFHPGHRRPRTPLCQAGYHGAAGVRELHAGRRFMGERGTLVQNVARKR